MNKKEIISNQKIFFLLCLHPILMFCLGFFVWFLKLLSKSRFVIANTQDFFLFTKRLFLVSKQILFE